MPPHRHNSVGQILLAQGHITRAQLQEALAEQGRKPFVKLAAILIRQGAITDAQARAALDAQDALDDTPMGSAVTILQRALAEAGTDAEARRDAAQKLREAVSAALARLKP